MAIAAREQRAPGLTDGQEEGRPDEASPEAEPAGSVIDLADLMLDQNGEVVLFNDSNLRSLTLRAGARLVRRGGGGRPATSRRPARTSPASTTSPSTTGRRSSSGPASR